jgi:hypothetical protein
MSKHTPGPWKIWEQYIARITDRHEVICQWGSYSSEADARLIAAAPELLKALKVLVALYGEDSVSMGNARAAIAKAEG